MTNVTCSQEAVSAAMTDIRNVRHLLETKTRPCRERSLALTKLDEAMFWIRSIPYDDGWNSVFELKQDLPVFGLNDFKDKSEENEHGEA